MSRSYTAPFFALILFFAMILGNNPAPANAQTSLITDLVASLLAPPAIPYYQQPPAYDPNLIWQPGYWANTNNGYFWVPGTWVQAPQPGLLWTPGFWAFNGNQYAWTPGYWGSQVGYYGGIDYGYGYYGNGFTGGNWVGNQFRYNTAVWNVNRSRIHNVFVDRSVVVNNWNRTSFNGGRGGINARPTASQVAFQHAHHVMPTNTQVAHQRFAMQNRANFSTANHGRPAVAAVARPLTSRPAASNVARSAPSRQTVEHAAAARMATQHAAAVQHAAVQHANVQRAAVQHAAVQHAAAQHAAVQRAPVQRAPVQRAPQQRAMAPQRMTQRAAAPQRAPAPQRAAAPPQRAARPAPQRPARPAPQAPPPDQRPGGGDRPH